MKPEPGNSSTNANDEPPQGWTNASVLEAIREGRLTNISGEITAEQLAQIVDEKGRSALDLAAEHRCLDQVLGGVTASQLSRVKDKHGWTALHTAAFSGVLHQIEGGVTATALADAKTEDGETALHIAVRQGHLASIRGGVTVKLLARTVGYNGWTALHDAAFAGCLYAIKGRVTAKRLFATRDNDGTNALFYAASGPRMCIDQISGGAGFSLLAQSKDKHGSTAIHEMARKGDLDQVSGGVTVKQLGELFDGKGKTALYVAAEQKNLHQIIGGATAVDLIRFTNRCGTPALIGVADIASITGGVTWAQLASVRDSGHEWRTALHMAAQTGQISKIAGGVTAIQLHGVVDWQNTTALWIGILHNKIGDINEGLPEGLLTQEQLDEACRIHLRTNFRTQQTLTANPDLVRERKLTPLNLQNVEKLIELGADPELLFSGIALACEVAELDATNDGHVDSIRELRRIAYNYGLVPPALPSSITKRMT